MKEIKKDIRDAIALAQDGIVQNTKDIALIQQQWKLHSEDHEKENEALKERNKTLYGIVGLKNRAIGAVGLIGVILTVYGVIIFTKLTGG